MLTAQALQNHNDFLNSEITSTDTNAKYPSSVSSMTSEMSNEDEEVETIENSSLWRVKHPERWAEVRLMQIHECLLVFRDNNFISYSGVDRAVSWAGSMLGTVLSDLKGCETKAMASSSYWSIHLCQIAFSKCEQGNGYTVSSQYEKELDRSVECWSIINMHRVLSGDKSKSFKDTSKGDDYQTTVSSQAARKNKVGFHALRGDARIKRLDIRPLGDETQRMKKSASFFQIWKQSGLPELDIKIINCEPPARHKFNASGSTREKIAAQALAGREELLAMKTTGRKVHGLKRAGMGAVNGSSVISRALFTKDGARSSRLSIGSTEAKLQSKQTMMHSDSESSDDEPEIGENGFPVARKKKGVSRNGAIDENENLSPIGMAALPSEDEEDVKVEKEKLLHDALQFTEISQKTRCQSPTVEVDKKQDDKIDLESSSSDEDEDGCDDQADQADQEDHTGPCEEGCLRATEYDLYEKSKNVPMFSIKNSDRDRIERVEHARDLQKRGIKLNHRQIKDIEWFEKLDLESLKHGEIKPRKRTRTFEETLKKKQKEIEKKKRAEKRKTLQKLREAVQKTILEERDERKLAIAKRRHEEFTAKLERMKARENRRVQKVNERLNDALRKERDRNRKKIEQYGKEAQLKSENAKKRNLDSIIRVGDHKVKILCKTFLPEAPIKPEELVASSYADVYKVEQRLAKRLKNGANVPMPLVAGGEGALRVTVKSRPGQRGGTRASATLERAIVESKKNLDVAQETVNTSASVAAAANAASSDAVQEFNTVYT